MALNKMSNPLTQHLIGLESHDGLTVVQHITLAGAQVSVNCFEQGRFAGAVGTDDAGQGPFFGDNIDILQNGHLFYVARRYVINLKRHNQCPRYASMTAGS